MRPQTISLHQLAILSCVLILSSAMSVTLSVFRVWYSGVWSYVFLNWNLLLAWIPLGLAGLLVLLNRMRPRPRLTLLTLLACWLLFFPNSPYIVSDLLHLDPRNNVPQWFDLIMLFSYAWNGLIIGFLSLWLVQQIVADWTNATTGWFFALIVLGATGFGIYLGRFERWNSWDILVNPTGLIHDIAVRIANPLDYPRTLAVTVLFAGFLTIAYVTVALLPQALRTERVPTPYGDRP
ncbi:MAG: DUF1361 domain-containing protein [Anaerolineales bacterium]|nr:DUF1361 domain-containing protein [Anaerolineales bacterium]